MKTCHGCGVTKDMATFEVYPYPEEDRICEEPVEPLFWMDVQPEGGEGWRRAGVCHECFHKLSPDMWIGQKHWEAIGPITPFDSLPRMPREGPG